LYLRQLGAEDWDYIDDGIIPSQTIKISDFVDYVGSGTQ